MVSDPSAVQQVATQLRLVVRQTDTGITRIETAAQEIGRAYDVLGAVAQGSQHAELLKTVHQFDAARQQINELLAVCDAARDAVQTYLDTLQVGQPAVQATPVIEATVPAQSRQGSPVQHRDGSYYPAAAGWAIDLLPRRVREGEEHERTVGQVMLAGSFAGQMTSGRDGVWTPEIQRRMRTLGIRVRIRVENHVEMKVAQMMIHTGNQTGEVVINHVPCGSQARQAIGCHQVLERYLLRGYILTVHGTTQQGRPFSSTYRGQA